MKQQVITSLQQAIDSLPHPSMEELASAPVTKMTEHDFITRQEFTTQTSYSHAKRIAIALCCLCLFFVVAKNFMRPESPSPYSLLTLDVNPGFEILLDKKNTIIAIQGVNEEAKAILKDSSYEGSDIIHSVSDLMLRLVNANYLTTNHNTILLTVQCPDEAFLLELESNLATTIQSTLQKENISPNLVIQKKTEKSPTSLPNDTITKGKQYFIDSILSKHPGLSGEKLGSLSLDELLTLLASGTLPAVSDKVASPTSPSDDNEDSEDTEDNFDDKDDKEDDQELEDYEENDNWEDSESEEELDMDADDEDDLEQEDEDELDIDQDSLEEKDSEDSDNSDDFEDENDLNNETEDSESNTLEDTDQDDSDSTEDTSIETNTGIQDVSDDDKENENDTDSSDDSDNNSNDDSDDDTDSDTDSPEEISPSSSDSAEY